MSIRRFLLSLLAGLAAVAVVLLLYLAFGDLSRHKPRIESFITERTGRSFAIDGAFDLEVLPAISVVAENVRLANAGWGSEPSMVRIGRLSTVVDLWSLFSGPVEIRTLELDDVAVLLETDGDGSGNWVFREPAGAEPETEPTDSPVTEVPVVLENAQLRNVRVTYREPDRDDRLAILETLSVTPGTEGLLAISGVGRLNEYAVTLEGEAGPVEALVSGRDLRMAIEASIGNLGVELDGGIGRLHPLDGADLRFALENPDVGTMLENLQLPVVATGALKAEATLKDAGERTGLDLDATLGDIQASVTGSVANLGLVGSDFEFHASVGDAARLAAVFGLEGLPKEPLRIVGRVAGSNEALAFEGVQATLAGAELRAEGTVPRSAGAGPTMRFEADVENLARLRAGMPEVPLEAGGTYAGNREGFEISDLRVRVSGSELSGAASVKRTQPRRVEAQLNSPRLDLTPFKKKSDAQGASEAAPTGDAAAQPAGKDPKAGKSGKDFVFADEPLPLDKLRGLDAHVQATLGEVVFEAGSLTDVSGTLGVAEGRLSLDLRARGAAATGTIDGAVRLVPSEQGAELTIKGSVRELRAGLLAPEGQDRSRSPPSNLEVDVRAGGRSPRQMASGANGTIVFTQGKGRVRKGALNVLGSDILNQIGGQLNPFSKQDPYTTLQCTVAQVKIVDGQATIDPVLIQSDKVTVTGQGAVDLRTEALTFDFNTRPRKGIGISPGMFTNPFIQLQGTLAQPRLATGAKGVVSGAVAVGTAGVSVVAKGLVDRVVGEADLCPSTLAEVSGGAKPAEGSAEAPANQE
jgi:uncharacterized protein involved in outer membrane biogenesis